MRDSVPHLLRSRLPRLSSPLAALSLTLLSLGLVGCEGKTKGQIILALQTDMSMPEDVTKVKIEVKTNGVSRYDNVFYVDPRLEAPDKIPATLAVVAGEKENETVELKVVALREVGLVEEPRTLSKAVTTIPTERIALLRVPMQWLCTDDGGDWIDDYGDGEYEPVDKDKACVGGVSKDVKVNSAKLPDWAEELVFGGSDDASDGTCFPTEECFDAGEDLTPDLSDCTVAFTPPNDEIVNFAVLAVNGGICSGSTCYVGLDKSEDFGWYELDDGAGPPEGGDGAPMRAPGMRRFQLPQGVCDRIADGRATGVRASSDESCLVTKTPRYPTCGPWSSVGKTPDEPPTDDADGDGFDRSVDCDDDDPTTYPGAPERCDTISNDCDDEIDESCVMDLPNSHHLDFSGTSGFTSTADYAIYQRFDVSTPLDLDQKTITFQPNSNHTRYTVTTADLEWDSDLGELVPVSPSDISSCDDCYSTLPLDFPFNFFGTEYQTVYPSSNGYLTFVMGDSTYTESVEYFLAGYPRIAALFNDLDTRGPEIQDEVYFYSSSSKLVVTYNNIQIYSQSGTENTFQFVLQSDGVIKISYDGMDDLDESSIAGITPGSIGGGVTCDPPYTACYGSCVDTETDPNNCGMCGSVCAAGLCFAGTCAGDLVCAQSNAPCEGTCVGSCVLPTNGGPCEGTCYGTCDGTCDLPDGSGGCNGVCDGDCTGQCYLSTGGACPDACTGNCYIDSAMTCAEPEGTPSGPCTFSGAQVTDATSCYDSAYASDPTAGTSYSWQLSCYGDECECCKQSTDTQSSQVCSVIDVTPATACRTEVTVRDTLLADCMTVSSCGAGCPGRPPADGSACDSTEITYCYYTSASVYCTCMTDPMLGDIFTCN